MGTLTSSPEPHYFFFEELELANTKYVTSIHFKNINLQYFAMLLDDNIIFANHYVIFKNYDNIKKKFVKRSRLTKQ